MFLMSLFLQHLSHQKPSPGGNVFCYKASDATSGLFLSYCPCYSDGNSKWDLQLREALHTTVLQTVTEREKGHNNWQAIWLISISFLIFLSKNSFLCPLFLISSFLLQATPL